MTLDLEFLTLATRRIRLNHNDNVIITLARDHKVSILLSYLKPGAQCPKVEIKFDADIVLNCFRECLQPAKATKHGRHILEDGSNISPVKLLGNLYRNEYWGPVFEPLDAGVTARLKRWQFVLRDRNGTAIIKNTGDESHEVWGALYNLTDKQYRRIEQHE
jgi:hypothetical protein